MFRVFCNTLKNYTSVQQNGLRNFNIDANLIQIRNLMLYNGLQQQKTTRDTTNNTNVTKKKTNHLPKITLIAPNQAVTITTLEEAQKLAKRRDLHLLKVQEMDSKTQRPVFKLVTTAEVLAEEMGEIKRTENLTEKNVLKKSEKSLTIGSRISEHDLSSRLKNISKWLSKNHEVRILIQGSPNDGSSIEKIFKTIEQSVTTPVTTGKIMQKHAKGTVTKFSIVPVNPTPTTTVTPDSGTKS